jgi:hypothetical protein
MAQPAPVDSHAEPADELFEMANLYPDSTGLPVTVWVSTRGGAKHDIRIKVNQQDGSKMSLDNTTTVAVPPSARLVHGTLTPQHQTAVFAWIRLNQDVLIALWEGQIDFLGFATSMKKI